MSIIAPLVSTIAKPPATSPAGLRWWRTARHITLALIGVFFLTTIREGHSWGDDFAQYLQHADNIVHSTRYAATGYIYNPQNAIVGPQAYPPGYPTALAPVAALYGANLSAYKTLGVLFFLIALLIATRLFSNDLSARDLWICLTIIGFSQVFWETKDGIMSEHLFIPLWYAALLAADDWYRRQKIYGSQMLHGMILGVLIFLTCATRAVGIVLLPVVVVCEAVIARRATRVGIVALLTSISRLAAERLFLPASGAGYLEQLQGISVRTLLENAYADTTSFSLIWQNGHWDSVRRIAGAGFAVLAAIGFLQANFSRPTPLGVAMAGYFAVIVVWPSADGLRMILPLVPGFVFYVLVGITSLRLTATRRTVLKVGASRFCQECPQGIACPSLDTRSPAGGRASPSRRLVIFQQAVKRLGRTTWFGRRRTTFPGRHGGWPRLWSRAPKRLGGSLALLLFSLWSFGAAYTTVDFGPFPTGVQTRPATELFEFVRTHTRPDEVCLFFKPRALALYTGRRASAYPLGTDEREFWQYAESIGAKVMIVREGAADRIGEDQTSEMRAPFAARDVEEVFHNSMFCVYRWKPTPLHAAK